MECIGYLEGSYTCVKLAYSENERVVTREMLHKWPIKELNTIFYKRTSHFSRFIGVFFEKPWKNIQKLNQKN